jgi:hypothetical protein
MNLILGKLYFSDDYEPTFFGALTLVQQSSKLLRNLMD